MKRDTPVSTDLSWEISGSYFEVCNCEAVCPCRKQGGVRSGTRSPRRWFMRASTWVEVRAARTVPSELGVTCGIPGHDQSGNEVIADACRVDDTPLHFDLRGRCGFESNFDYSSEEGS